MQQQGSKYFARRPQQTPTPDPLVGVKIQLFQNMIMLHINLKRSRMQQHGSKYFARRAPLPLRP